MAHLAMTGSASSSSDSAEDVDLCSDSDAYEIPQPNYVAPLPAPKKKERPAASTQLHDEIDKFSKLLEMDSEEIRRKKELIQV